MRVIAGIAGGLKLTAPAGTATRPTADRVKEALFSILESAGLVTDAEVLDLFAGSGALAIEALSRGASHATLIEKARSASAVIVKNLQHTKLQDRATVMTTDVLVGLEQLQRRDCRYDLIMLDPPYAAGLQEPVIAKAAALLKPQGVLVAEAASRSPLPRQLGACRCYDRRLYGDTALEFYHLEESDAP